jgi:hypothetical protein
MQSLLHPGAHDGAPAPHPGPAPRRRARSAGRLRHRFPRSHGPAKHKVKTQWLTLRCPANSSQAAPRRISSGPCVASGVEMSKEPKSRTIPGESAMIMRQADPALRRPVPPPAKAQEKLSRYRLAEPCAGRNDVKQARRTREPQESWRILDMMLADPTPARNRPLFGGDRPCRRRLGRGSRNDVEVF